MKLCERHTNVQASADFCAICLLDERDELRSRIEAMEGLLKRMRPHLHPQWKQEIDAALKERK